LKKKTITTTIKLFITNLQPNHYQILAKSTIFKKIKAPLKRPRGAGGDVPDYGLILGAHAKCNNPTCILSGRNVREGLNKIKIKQIGGIFLGGQVNF
jgi:hypothetical protein